MTFTEYTRYDALGLADLVRRREVTALEVVDAAISRIERHDLRTHSVVQKLYDRARSTATRDLGDGPFAGVPFLMKDLLVQITGLATTEGSRMFARHRATHDSELVKRYHRAGLLLVGRSNTPEFGIPPYTEPELHGPTRNPWNLEHSPGGSSGGSAAAVAARLVPMAHGGDGGGSIRIPASCCGVFGLKPTRGRTPTGPDYGELWQGLAVEHVLSLSVRDSAAALDATHGPDVGAPYIAPAPSRPFLDEVTTEAPKLRVAFTERPLLAGEVHHDCKTAVRDAAKLLESLGHTVEEATPTVEAESLCEAFLVMLAGETAASIDAAGVTMQREPTPQDFERETWLLGTIGRSLSAADFAKATATLSRAGRQVGPFFERYDVLLTPTLGQPPARTGSLRASGLQAMAMEVFKRLPVAPLLRAMIGPMAAQAFAYTPWTPVFNITGQPAMSVPLYWNAAGLPIGAHLVGRFGDEATLLQLAGQLERARPWANKVPPGFGGA